MKKTIINYLYEHLYTDIPYTYLQDTFSISLEILLSYLEELKSDGYYLTINRDSCFLRHNYTKILPVNIQRYLHDLWIIDVYETIDSTNTQAKREPFVSNKIIVSNHQSMGRGRSTNSFYSPNNTGIYFSIIHSNNTDITKLSIIASIAVYQAIKELFDLDLQVKWVNDLYIEDHKVGGILVEYHEDKVIIGIGLNLLNDLHDLQTNTRKDVTTLHVVTSSRSEIIACITNHYYSLLHTNFQDILSIYKQQSCLLNKDIFYSINDKNYYGKVMDINEDGHLVVNHNNKVITLSSGEVHIESFYTKL